MPVDPDTQQALDALAATVAQHRQQAIARFTALDARIDNLEGAAGRLREALKEGRLGEGEKRLGEAFAADLRASLGEIEELLRWWREQRRRR